MKAGVVLKFVFDWENRIHIYSSDEPSEYSEMIEID